MKSDGPAAGVVVDYKELKAMGFLRQKQGDKFSLRLRVVGGNMTAKQLAVVARAAEKYGKGHVHFTSRQSVEIPFVDVKNVAAIRAFLRKHGLETGAGGATVRTVTACQGNAICASGRIDTASLATAIAERYRDRPLPHKFKIGITGCPNNCLKAEENDLGIKGGYALGRWNKEACTLCGLCLKLCRKGALSLSRKRLRRDDAACNKCGRCVVACPLMAWEGEPGYILSFGGLFGNRIARGESILPVLDNTDAVLRVADAALEFYCAHGVAGERFRFAVERAGWNVFTRAMRKAAAAPTGK